MTLLILGYKDSGKSELAEKIATSAKTGRLYYLATMKVCDEEGKKRVLAHRKMREGKGFITIEKEYGIDDVIRMIEEPEDATVLLECVSNLVGNELFENPYMAGFGMKNEGSDNEDEYVRFADYVTAEIKALGERVLNLILVSNTYRPDDPSYDDETRLYIRLLDMVNERLEQVADRIYDLRSADGKDSEA